MGIKLFVLPLRPAKAGGPVHPMQKELERYLAYYNTRRPHMALGGLAPMEFMAILKEGGSQSRMY